MMRALQAVLQMIMARAFANYVQLGHLRRKMAVMSVHHALLGRSVKLQAPYLVRFVQLAVIPMKMAHLAGVVQQGLFQQKMVSLPVLHVHQEQPQVVVVQRAVSLVDRELSAMNPD